MSDRSWSERAAAVGVDLDQSSIVLDTNKGGVPFALCVCGVLVICGMGAAHVEQCPAAHAEITKREDPT